MRKIILCLVGIVSFAFGNTKQKIVNNFNMEQNNNIQENEFIEIAKNYLNNLKTLEANFTQSDGWGISISGRIWIDRKNGKFKLETSQRRTVIKDSYMYDFNKDLEETTKASIYSSPLAFLLDKKIDFKGLEILRVECDNRSFSIRFAKKDKNIEGQVELHFQNKKLSGWTFYNNDNDVIGTTIKLHGLKINQEIDEEVFEQ